MKAIWRSIVDVWDDVDYWWTENGALVVAAVLFVVVVIGAGALIKGILDAVEKDNIDQCVRAFDYTRDQCEFIVRNRVRP